MTYMSPFAQKLSDLIHKGASYRLRMNVFCQDNWLDLYNMPYHERYQLISEIADCIALGDDGQEEKDDENRLYGEAATFLAMTIPYEPLSKNEQRHALQIESYIDAQENSRKSSSADKLKKIREFSGLYAVLEGIPNKTNLGTYSLSSVAPEIVKKEFNKYAAFYMNCSLSDDKYFEYLLTQMACDRLYNIVFHDDYLNKATDIQVIVSGLHEMCHYTQDVRGLKGSDYLHDRSNIYCREIDGVDAYIPYIVFMEERQPYAFEGWISDAREKQPLRSELQITCDLLLSNYGFGADVIDPIYAFNDFASQLREKQLRAAGYSPCKNQPRVS